MFGQKTAAALMRFFVSRSNAFTILRAADIMFEKGGQKTMRYAIYGAGAMGTVLGAHIARAGGEIDLFTRNAEHVAAMREHGAQIAGLAPFVQKVRAFTPEKMCGKYDVIVLMTKQRRNAEIVQALLPHLAQDGAICTCQNGLPEPEIAKIVGADRTLGCAVAWGATYVRPGVCELTSDPNALTFSLGACGAGNRLAETKSLFEMMGTVRVEPDLMGARWAKLLINSAFSGLSALTGATFGEIAHEKLSRRVAQCILQEGIEVARASKVQIAPLQGHRIDKLLGYRGRLGQARSFLLIPIAMKKHARLLSGMLRDIRRGVPCEIDYINGAVVKWAERCGRFAPFNARTVLLVRAVEGGEYPLSMENVKLFEDLLR